MADPVSSPSALQVWLAAARPKTLPAAVIPVLVGTAWAHHAGSALWPAAAACLLFALLIQVGTNFANDYFDYVKGADTAERVGPRRAVASGWVSPPAMRAATAVVFALAFAVGLSLVRYGGWGLVPLGLLCVLCGLAYTGGPYPLGYHGLGDLFVFLFFGLVAVAATTFVQAGEVRAEVWASGAVIGLLATNLLVVNNYRDAETDARAGKRTLVVRWGKRAARGQHGLSLAASLLLPAFLGWRLGSAWLLLPWFLAPLAFLQIRALRRARTPAELISLLGKTAAYLAGYGLLLTLGLWAARGV